MISEHVVIYMHANDYCGLNLSKAVLLLARMLYSQQPGYNSLHSIKLELRLYWTDSVDKTKFVHISRIQGAKTRAKFGPRKPV